MLIVGLTGSLSTGKTTVAGMFRKCGAKVIDADKIAHQVLKRKKIIDQVAQCFGKEILKGTKIDRERLANIVFNDKKALEKLENIVHPEVIKIIKRAIREQKENKKREVMVLDVPLLFETKLNRLVDKVVVVKTTQKLQIERAVKNLGITKAEARRRIKAQMSLHEKIQLADFIIDNSKNINQTQKQVKAIWEKL